MPFDVLGQYYTEMAKHTLIETSKGKACFGDPEALPSNVEGGRRWRQEQAHAQDGLKDLASVERELSSALSRIRLMREDGWN